MQITTLASLTMKYGTQTRLKYLVPPNKLGKIRKAVRSKKAKLRQQWIDHYHKYRNIAFTARHFGISETTIGYWVRRYDKEVPNCLENKSTIPHHIQQTPIPNSTKEKIIALRTIYPGWGKVKIQVLLKREGISVGQSRIQMVMNQAGLKRIPSVKKRIKRVNRKHMYTVPSQIKSIPGGLVYMDVKHLWLPGHCYQFTAIDHATRRLHTKCFQKITSYSGKRFLQELEVLWGVAYLGTDNGSEFLGKCDQYCHEKGIQHVFSSPHSPRQNPYVERVIRTIIDEVYYFTGLELNVGLQQAKLAAYEEVYNTIRPHQTLNYLTPLEQYAKLTSVSCSS